MQRLISNFNSGKEVISIRIIVEGESILFSALDINKALDFKEPLQNKELIRTIVDQDKHYVGMQSWVEIDGKEKRVLFIDQDYVYYLIMQADVNAGGKFIKWLVRTILLINDKYIEKNESALESGSNYSGNLYATTQIAKMYGMSARELNRILHENGIQYKVNKQWVLYSKYQDKGYTVSKSFCNEYDDNDDIILHTYWTSKGLGLIEDLMAQVGYMKIEQQRLDL